MPNMTVNLWRKIHDTNSTASPAYCGGMQQLGSKKRKKHSLLDGNLETPSSRSRVG